VCVVCGVCVCVCVCVVKIKQKFGPLGVPLLTFTCAAYETAYGSDCDPSAKQEWTPVP